MFAIQRKDPRKAPELALESAEMWTSMFTGVERIETPGSLEWTTRLYDLAFFLFEMHENVAAQRITEAQHAHAIYLVRRVAMTLYRDFPGFALPARVDAALCALCTLLDKAAGLALHYEAPPDRHCHSRVSWLQNIAHNAWHDRLWNESDDDHGRARRTSWRPTIITSTDTGKSE